MFYSSQPTVYFTFPLSSGVIAKLKKKKRNTKDLGHLPCFFAVIIKMLIIFHCVTQH